MSKVPCKRVNTSKTVMHQNRNNADRCPYCRRAEGKKALSSRGANYSTISNFEPLPVDLSDESQFEPGNHHAVMILEAQDLLSRSNPIAMQTICEFSLDNFHESNYTGYYKTSRENHPVTVEWRNDDDFSDDELKFLLADGRTDSNGELKLDDHFSEWAKENGLNSKNYWNLSIEENSDYYSKMPNHVLLEPSEEGAELLAHYEEMANSRTDSVKVTDPVEYLSRGKGKTVRTGLLSEKYFLDKDLRSTGVQALIDKFEDKNVTSMKAEKLTMKEMQNTRILRPDDYARVQPTEKINKWNNQPNYGRTASGSHYHGVIIATPKTKSPAGRGDYELHALDGYSNLKGHLSNGNRYGQKEWLIYYTD